MNVVVFDFNGLVVDDEPIQLKATQHVLSPYGIDVTEDDWIRFCVGRKPAEFIPKLIKKDVSKDELGMILHQKDQAYVTYVIDEFDDLVTEGTMELLAYCAGAGIKIGLATSTPRSELGTLQKRTGSAIFDRFGYVISGDCVEYGKPHPEIYLKVIEHFGKDKNYVVFEDSEPGVTAASDAGLACIAVPNRYTENQNFSRAQLTITNLTRDAEVITGY